VTPLVAGSFAAWKARHTTATAPAIETLDDLRALAAAG
jgi:hypothetical protein